MFHGYRPFRRAVDEQQPGRDQPQCQEDSDPERFAKDQPGVSNCNDNCAKNWPPLAAAADAKPMGDWTVITRADGTKQWAYKGMPLYTWSKDAKPGDATGAGMGNGAWKVAAP